jgi:hypothetical protein
MKSVQDGFTGNINNKLGFLSYTLVKHGSYGCWLVLPYLQTFQRYECKWPEVSLSQMADSKTVMINLQDIENEVDSRKKNLLDKGLKNCKMCFCIYDFKVRFRSTFCRLA